MVWKPRSKQWLTFSSDEVVDNLRRIMGVMQHHDAVTGTEKQHVSNDYAERLYLGTHLCHRLISTVAEKSSPRQPQAIGGFQVCDRLNISVCEMTAIADNLDVQISIFNPLGWEERQPWMRIPLRVPFHDTSRVNITLFDQQSGETIEYQLSPVSPALRRIPERRLSPHRGNLELVFKLPYLQPTGFTNIALKTQHNQKGARSATKPAPGGGKYQLVINNNSEPEFKYKLDSGKEFTLTVGLEHYFSRSMSGSNGAYLFNTRESSLIVGVPKSEVS